MKVVPDPQERLVVAFQPARVVMRVAHKMYVELCGVPAQTTARSLACSQTGRGRRNACRCSMASACVINYLTVSVFHLAFRFSAGFTKGRCKAACCWADSSPGSCAKSSSTCMPSHNKPVSSCNKLYRAQS